MGMNEVPNLIASPSPPRYVLGDAERDYNLAFSILSATIALIFALVLLTIYK